MKAKDVVPLLMREAFQKRKNSAATLTLGSWGRKNNIISLHKDKNHDGKTPSRRNRAPKKQKEHFTRFVFLSSFLRTAQLGKRKGERKSPNCTEVKRAQENTSHRRKKRIGERHKITTKTRALKLGLFLNS